MKVSKVQSVSEELRTQQELVNAGFHWRWAFVGWDFAARAEAAEALNFKLNPKPDSLNCLNPKPYIRTLNSLNQKNPKSEALTLNP